MQVFGEIGVLADDGEKVQCHLCGKWFSHLGNHALYKHKIAPDDYRAVYGLNRTTGLISNKLREVLHNHGNKVEAKYGTFKKHWAENLEKNAMSRPHKKHRQESKIKALEAVMNGVCPLLSPDVQAAARKGTKSKLARLKRSIALKDRVFSAEHKMKLKLAAKARGKQN